MIVSAQVYSEPFDGQEGVGIRGLCSSDPLSCDTAHIPSQTGWTITGDASGLLNADDHFVVTGAELVARDTDGQLCFESPFIDVSECDTTIVSLRLDETGDLESSDYADVFLIRDTAHILIVDAMGSGDSTHTVVGDFPDDQDWH